ncbi:nitrogenase component 1 [Candidatus Contubernalis alkaliaceticus]|uniref:nitrogenase component 1 n=1 Tax=Candidatus Contubernalis alkaliaceticus TaxID=338645 RepID=UPI001F4C0FB3|nr:nitrogenase component 1 [Candidatus Contubernalis alkalaceticus]UNC93076.1 oxalate:formate antiporter [Candidatus Contubernalis alkalaceticus]
MAEFQILESLNRVSKINTAKDIKQLSHAQFPGTHCPLFGVALTAGYINGLFALVVGTDECSYYTKSFIIDRKNGTEGLSDNFLSFAVNQDDVVFGCHDKLQETVIKIDQQYRPKAILLVTTCILEVIGEDLKALIYSVKEKVQAKLVLVKTEHFKCNSHIPGIERTLEALVQLMEEQPVKERTINLLGHRYNGAEETELVKLLQSRGVQIHTVLPSRCSIDLIKTSPSAALNIVTDFTALTLAEKIEKKFGTPYVYFDKYLNLSRIEQGYLAVAEKLGLNLSSEIKHMKEQAVKAQEKYQALLKGKSFIYANTPLLAFEFCGFLTGLGMKPILIQARDLYVNDDRYLQEILEFGQDPYVSRIANIAPLQALYGQLSPDFYIGHENPMLLMEKGIVQVVLDGVAKKLGFEVPVLVMKTLADSLYKFKFMAEGGGHHAAVV